MAILSIQSHVVYGYAGNTAAVFPLQRLGREVWAVNTVEFSNHTGYRAWRGRALGAELAGELVEGVADRGVLGNCEAVLSGYMGDSDVGNAVIAAVRLVRKAAGGALYCCDPVMGDLGRGFYVKEGIPEKFRDEVIPLADIVTPNQFELEALTGMNTASLAGARDAINALHRKGPAVVLVTSYYEGSNPTRMEGTVFAPPGYIDMLVSDSVSVYRVRTPALPFPGGMAGSGDLCTAVFLSRYLESRDVKTALERTAASVYGIMDATYRAGSGELALIAAQDELPSPSRVFVSEKL
ncbi:MAG: pyridoxal kinase PdxY [Spirochaetaceae bacterium]|jgi:pyridoxine kinase|nr:pyridoxal kinase PdxY [Spirochaetaceae bacterium]